MSGVRVSSTSLAGEESVTDEPETQADKFEKLAKELECDEDEAAFQDKVRKVVGAKIEPVPKAPS